MLSIQRCTILAALLLICGCYHSPYQGYYGQPGYYQAQPGQLQPPGQLVIPDSGDAPLAPYDDDLGEDSFRKEEGGDGSFFGEDGGVPDPRGSGSGGFGGDY